MVDEGRIELDAPVYRHLPFSACLVPRRPYHHLPPVDPHRVVTASTRRPSAFQVCALRDLPTFSAPGAIHYSTSGTALCLLLGFPRPYRGDPRSHPGSSREWRPSRDHARNAPMAVLRIFTLATRTLAPALLHHAAPRSRAQRFTAHTAYHPLRALATPRTSHARTPFLLELAPLLRSTPPLPPPERRGREAHGTCTDGDSDRARGTRPTTAATSTPSASAGTALEMRGTLPAFTALTSRDWSPSR